MTSWSDCEAPSGGYPCTTGIQTRKAICVQKHGMLEDLNPRNLMLYQM